MLFGNSQLGIGLVLNCLNGIAQSAIKLLAPHHCQWQRTVTFGQNTSIRTNQVGRRSCTHRGNTALINRQRMNEFPSQIFSRSKWAQQVRPKQHGIRWVGAKETWRRRHHHTVMQREIQRDVMAAKSPTPRIGFRWRSKNGHPIQQRVSSAFAFEASNKALKPIEHIF